MDSLPPQRHLDETSPPVKFLTGANMIPIAPLRSDATETCAEPEENTTAPLAPAEGWVGTVVLPPNDIPKPSFDGETTPTEVTLQVPRKPERGGFCQQCPDLPSFASKAQLRKHRRQFHPPSHSSSLPKCPLCRARVSKQHLERHLKKVHGMTDTAVGGTAPLPTSTPLDTSSAVQVPQARSEDAEAAIITDTSEITEGRVYCQEYDCGRGFSSKVHLDSHVRFFHSRKFNQVADVPGTPSTPRGEVEQPKEQPPSGFYPQIPVIPPHPEERASGCDPCLHAGIGMPRFGIGCRGTYSTVETPKRQPEIPVKPSISTGDDVNALSTPVPQAAGIVPLLCRMCDAPPTARTQPTVTTCGHLFCFECIKKHVSSTSRCAVCNNSLLLFCLFKLDLPVTF